MELIHHTKGKYNFYCILKGNIECFGGNVMRICVIWR